jgi:hypothetical protein
MLNGLSSFVELSKSQQVNKERLHEHEEGGDQISKALQIQRVCSFFLLSDSGVISGKLSEVSLW